MPDTDQPVYYTLPDGTKVSNDPRFFEQLEKEKAEASLEIPKEEVTLSETPAPKGSDSSEVATSDGLDELTSEQLKVRLVELRAAGVSVNTTGITRKAELVEAIRKALAAN